MNHAGIDVGCHQVHVVIAKGDDYSKVAVFDNDHSGFKRLQKVLKKHRVTQVVLEATGVYHLDLALFLHESPKIDVMVLNPKAAKHYAEARMSRTKTDAVDARLLAEFAVHMPFDTWQPPSRQILMLRTCSRRLASLTKQLTQSKNQLHALEKTKSTPDFILEDTRFTIDQLNAQIARLQTKTVAMIQEDETLKNYFEQLIAIKGIAEKSAIQLLGELLVLPKDMRAKQWVAMAGLDPRQHQSGSRINKKARISKVGNRYLRQALYMPALAASRHTPQVRAYYLHLIEDRGLKRIQALCAVMRKLLHAIHGMWKNAQPFDASRFYAMPESKPIQ